VTVIQRCETCKYWAEGAQGNEGFGTCQRIDDNYPPEPDTQAMIQTAYYGSSWMETRPDFGCTLHERKDLVIDG